MSKGQLRAVLAAEHLLVFLGRLCVTRVVVGRVALTLVHLAMTLEVALVTRRVVALIAREVLLSAVHRQMALQQRLTTKIATTEPTHVSIAMKYDDVVAQ